MRAGAVEHRALVKGRDKLIKDNQELRGIISAQDEQVRVHYLYLYKIVECINYIYACTCTCTRVSVYVLVHVQTVLPTCVHESLQVQCFDLIAVT